VKSSSKSASAPLSPGTLLSHYLIQQQIGAGSGGVVYRAFDQRLKRAVAIKVVDPSLVGDATWALAINEARAAGSLAHPNICTVFDVEEEEGQVYLAMELVEGRSLDAAIPGHGLGCDAAARYGAQIASALAHAHERGVCHGDVSARNVMLTADDCVKVLDFGLARLGAETVSPATPSEPARRDLQQLGILLCLMTTGIFPPQALDVLVANTPPSAILESPPVVALPEGMRSVIAKCLDPDPLRSYQRAPQVVADLEAQVRAVAKPESGPARGFPWRRASLAAAAGGLLLAAVIAIHPFSIWKAHTAGAPSSTTNAVPAAPTKIPAQGPRATGRPDAKVWANTKSKIYHCSNSVLYGKTLEGKFMTQQEALAAGYRPARNESCQ
jgi:serine/threonine-protein kinase